MDKPAAALATSIGVLLFLMWRQFQGATPITVGSEIKTIVLMTILVVGLSVYIQSHASR
jgi:hypothetical protein